MDVIAYQWLMSVRVSKGTPGECIVLDHISKTLAYDREEVSYQLKPQMKYETYSVPIHFLN